METKTNLIEPLFEKIEEYGKTSFELIKLKSLDKTVKVTSTLISRLILVIVLSFFALTLNIAVALWLGDILGKGYYGFLVVASFYAFVGIILLFIHPLIKTRVSNSIVKLMLN